MIKGSGHGLSSPFTWLLRTKVTGGVQGPSLARAFNGGALVEETNGRGIAQVDAVANVWIEDDQ